MKHRVTLFGEITEDSIGRAMEKILDVAGETGNGKKKDIWLLISSHGGDASQVVVFDQFLKANGIKINTIVIGNAHSVAAEILELGEIRVATKESSILFHRGDLESTRMQHVDNVVPHFKSMVEFGMKLVRRRVGRPIADIRRLYDAEKYLTAPEAKRQRLIDRIVGKTTW